MTLNNEYFDTNDSGKVTMKKLPDDCIHEVEDKIIINIPKFVDTIRGNNSIVSYNHNGVTGILENTRYKSVYDKSVYMICTQPVSVDSGQFNVAQIRGNLDLTEFNLSKLRNYSKRLSLNIDGILKLNSTLTIDINTVLFRYSKIGKIDFNGAKILLNCNEIFKGSQIGILDLTTADLSDWKSFLDDSRLSLDELNKIYSGIFNQATINAIKIDSERQLGISLARAKDLFGTKYLKSLDFVG